jgi:hypothetical protein
MSNQTVGWGILGTNIVVETANSPRATGLAFDLAAPLRRVILFGLYPEELICRRLLKI